MLISRGRNRFVDEVRAPNVSHNVSSAEFLSEQASSKKTDLREGPDTRPRVLETKPTRVGKPEANPITLTERPVYFTKRTIPALERKRRIIPSGPTHARKYLSSAISKMVTKLVRHFDQDERQTDAAVHWDSIRPVLLKTLADKGAQEFSEQEWIQHVRQGSEATCLFRVRFITVAIGNMFKTPFIG